MRWRKSKRPTKGRDLTAFIDEGSEIEGKYTFNGTVMLNGKFSGEIVSSDSLIIGEKGVVNATVRAGIVLITCVRLTSWIRIRAADRCCVDFSQPSRSGSRRRGEETRSARRVSG
jgi:Polymer-forming cytoskeletal